MKATSISRFSADLLGDSAQLQTVIRNAGRTPLGVEAEMKPLAMCEILYGSREDRSKGVHVSRSVADVFEAHQSDIRSGALSSGREACRKRIGTPVNSCDTPMTSWRLSLLQCRILVRLC